MGVMEGDGSDGGGWDGSDVGRSLSFVCGGSLSSMGGGSRHPGALSCSCCIVCEWGASFVGMGSRLGVGGFICGRGASFVDGGVVVMVVWWLQRSSGGWHHCADGRGCRGCRGCGLAGGCCACTRVVACSLSCFASDVALPCCYCCG